MSENSNGSPRFNGKKRYFAMAALACLVAAGGGLGATVTHQVGAENNKIQYKDATKDDATKKAKVAFSGDPLNVQWDAADTAEYKDYKWTMKNDGDAVATINGMDIDGAVMGKGFDKDTHWRLTATEGNRGTVLLDKDLAHEGAGKTRTTSLAPKQSVEITARLYKPQFAKTDAEQARDHTYSFDVNFSWITAGKVEDK